MEDNVSCQLIAGNFNNLAAAKGLPTVIDAIH